MFLIKSVYLLDTFLGRFFMKPKLNKYFPCFCYDIYFKNNLGLPLDFKVINVKNLYSKNLKGKFKYCNVNIFQLLNFCNCRISYFGSNIFVISYLCKKKVEPHVFVLSILQSIWQDFAIACKSFNRRRKYVLINGI